MKKLLLLASTLFLVTPVSSAEITSRMTDSIQLTVEGPAIQSNRIGSTYSVSGSNISVSTLGGLTGGSATAAPTVSTGSYDINTDGQSFSFAETTLIGDTPITAQSALSSNGRFDSPSLYGSSTTSVGGSAGTLAGTLSPTGVPTVVAGGPGTTAIGQRTMELSVFR